MNFSISDWKKTILPKGSTIAEVIKCMNESKYQIVIIYYDDLTFYGIITDGDIRRGLINGIDLNSDATLITQTKPLIAHNPISPDQVNFIMSSNKINHLPIINSNNKIEELYLNEYLIDKPIIRNNSMIIMAGGRGKRMGSYTDDCPKPMLKILGKPMLEHILIKAKLEGFSNFIITINYLGHIIENYFQNGEKWGIKIQYIREDQPLGTAGALGLINFKMNFPILIINGDVLSDTNFNDIIDFHLKNNSDATMAVSQHTTRHNFGVINTNDFKIITIEEKPLLTFNINSGIYVLNQYALSKIPKNQFLDMTTLFTLLINENKNVLSYPIYEKWNDIGRPEDLLEYKNIN
jgi:dTDP-glucose pyrophosphorylase